MNLIVHKFEIGKTYSIIWFIVENYGKIIQQIQLRIRAELKNREQSRQFSIKTKDLESQKKNC